MGVLVPQLFLEPYYAKNPDMSEKEVKELVIREFRYADLDALITIAKASFAEEYIASGQSPDSFVRQVRMVVSGRMIPFTLLSILAGIQWKLYVAEVDGAVVGCSSYMGRKTMELANLMIHPEYRRRGIGQALLEKRLQHLKAKGYPFVKTTVLATNEASLGNLHKQGFEVFDRYSVLEIPLPLRNNTTGPMHSITSRQVKQSDIFAFKEIEIQVANPAWLQIQGSAAPNYFPSRGDQLMQQFTNGQRWTRVFVKNTITIGFLSASTSSSHTKGTLFRPVVAQENIEHLSQMLQEAAVWLQHLGKETMQIGIPDESELLIDELQNNGWVKTLSWVQLVKWLER